MGSQLIMTWRWLREIARIAVASFGMALLLVVVLAHRQILPLMLAPGVTLEVASLFGLAFLKPALEWTSLIFAPVAMARAIFATGRDGVTLGNGSRRSRSHPTERTAERPEGIRRQELVRNAWGMLLCIATLTLVVRGIVAASDSVSHHPGRFASALLEAARSRCQTVTQPERITVPIVGLAWLCAPSSRPHLVGSWLQSGGRAWFSAGTLKLEPGRNRLVADDVALLLARTEPKLRVFARRVEVIHLPAYLARPPPKRDRWFIVAGTAWLCALTVALLGGRGVRGPCLAEGAGWAGGLAAALWLRAFDAGVLGALGPIILAPASCATLALLWFALSSFVAISRKLELWGPFSQ